MINIEKTLEFDQIKEKLAGYACSEKAKEMCRALEPSLSETEVEARLRDTTEGKWMLERCGNPPVAALQGVREYLITAGQGGCLMPEQLEEIALTLTAVRRMKDYLNRGKRYEWSLPYYEENLNDLEDVREEISLKIRNGQVDDYASRLLKTLRERIEDLEARMREKAEQLLRTNKSWMSDSFSTVRNGHICIPVKKEYRNKIAGNVIDKSATGSTLFLEPSAAAKYFEELQMAKLEEENEERRILYTLTDMLADKEEMIEQNFRIMEKLDFVFAKAKLSMEYQGTKPIMNTGRRICLVRGRHPLMDPRVSVPLDFEIGGAVQGIVITGPNTGGKTVAIKTVALNCLMAQCGLHVACEKAEICLNNWILCDIEDGQSLSENLSTFSAHIRSVLEILKRADRDSLVVLDELGSGTDPAEGMGIAVAILEELRQSGALFLATTHYPEVKQYAEKTEGVQNARMTFDKESLRPLYQLVQGEAGESCAFSIARRLGMPARMLERAEMAAYGEQKEVRTVLPERKNQTEEEKKDGMKLQPEEACGKGIRQTRDFSAGEPVKRYIRRKETGNKPRLQEKFQRGDSVMVYPDKKKGIVCEPVNEKGILRVQLPRKKIWISHKRVKLLVAAAELYPEDYDFSILFDTVENRKLRHDMERKYVKDGEIRITE